MAARSLDRILMSQGFGTRKACATLIRQGRVMVEGETLRDPKASFELEGLPVCVDDVEWRCASKCYLALHKPGGVECSRNPTHHPSVLTLLPQHIADRGVQPVGRLDQDSTGLLLLTDDGGFNHALSSPKRHVPKRYLVRTVNAADDDLVASLLEGVSLHGESEPSVATACRRVGEFEVEVTISEGKYHQVKRMIAAAGNKCASLHRVAIGALELSAMQLAVGDHRQLTPAELELLAPVWPRTE